MPTGPDLLGSSGKPLFFPVARPRDPGISMPAPRSADQEAVRVFVRSLSVMQKEALVVSARTGAVWRLASDEGAYLDGHDVAPCPLSFFSVGMVASYMNEILALALQRGIVLLEPQLTQDNYYTMKGSALQGTMTGGAKDIDLALQVRSSATDDQLRALVCDAIAASPLNDLMRGVRPSLFTLNHNDIALPLEESRSIAGPVPLPPGNLLDTALPLPGDWSGLVQRGPPSPRHAHTSTFAGGSLADQQDRLLHVRVICTLRGDGLKQVEQHLYNPHGSIFHFLSEEAPAHGGAGRAPDAAAFLSAGVGFCFMTQLGRYSRIVKKELSAYSIVQDTRFSAGGASGGTGRSGRADPVETHVFLRSAQDSGFARTCLDMSEQTCFLHAFCRTDLKARVKIRRLPR
jgi:hypothetical protein